MSSGIQFGTDGWRSIIADQFTYSNVRIVSQAISEHLKSVSDKPHLVIGYDNRFQAQEFAIQIASVCAANNVSVTISETSVPTPVAACAVIDQEANGAVMLTASHNPYYYNGIKFIPEYAGPATEEITRSIEKHIEKVVSDGDVKTLDRKGLEESGLCSFSDLTPSYVTRIKRLVDFDKLRRSKIKVIADPLYGAGTSLIKDLLEDAGVVYHVIHDQRDVLFGGGLPDPSEERLQKLKSLILDEKADVGLGLDGDADRIGLIADDGRYVNANQVIALLLKYLVEKRSAKGCVVRTVATTHLIDAIADKHQLEVIETPVGFKYVGSLMRERDVIIGGEESGGLSIGGHIPEKDGILANLLVCEMLSVENKNLSTLIDEMFNEFGKFINKRLDLVYPENKKKRLLDHLSSIVPTELAGRSVSKSDTKDGIRLILVSGEWVLIRPSGTEPLIRVYIEAKSEDSMDKLVDDIQVMIAEI